MKGSSGMWCDVTADSPRGLGSICVTGIPQFICSPQGITALLRGLEHSDRKAYFRGKMSLSKILAVFTRLAVYVNLQELYFS